MTSTDLKTLIDTQITNETVDFAITPAEVGGRMKDVIDYVDQQVPYKSFIGKLDIDGSDVPSITTIFNNLCTSISCVKNNTGVYIATIIGGTFTNGKTFIPNRRYSLFASSSPLNVYLQASGTTLTFSYDDGNSAIKGAWIEFEVRVYN